MNNKKKLLLVLNSNKFKLNICKNVFKKKIQEKKIQEKKIQEKITQEKKITQEIKSLIEESFRLQDELCNELQNYY